MLMERAGSIPVIIGCGAGTDARIRVSERAESFGS
jgi:hypothetical protein